MISILAKSMVGSRDQTNEQFESQQSEESAQPSMGKLMQICRHTPKRASAPVIHQLIISAQEHIEDVSLQAEVCHVLRAAFVGSESVLSHFSQADGFQWLVGIMRDVPSDAVLQDAACALLRSTQWDSSFSDHYRTQFAAAGGSDVLLTALRTHAHVLLSCFVVISHLGKNADIRQRLMQGGCAELVVSAMHAQDVSDVQERACAALRALSSVEDEYRQHIASCGGLDAALAALTVHKGSPRVVEQACGVLSHLARVPELAVRIAGEGMQLLLMTLANHTGNGQTLPAICRALAFVVAYNATEFVQNGGVQLLITGMRTHLDNKNVHSYARAALINLATDAVARQEIASHGGVEVVIADMQNDPHDPNTQQQACCLLRNLSQNNKANAARIVQACHGIELLVECMKTFHDDAAIQEAACGALRNLALGDVTRQAYVVREGGVQVLLAAIREHDSHSDVLQQACATLGNLNMIASREARELLLSAVDLMLLVMKSHSADAALQQIICEAFASLCSHPLHGSGIRTHVAKHGGVQLISAALRVHHTETAYTTLAKLAVGVLPTPDSAAAVFKVVVVGHACSGKSSLVSRFATASYPEQHLPTHGAELVLKTLQQHSGGSGEVQLQIWDTSCEPSAQDIVIACLQGAHAVLVVYDTTSAESLSTARSYCDLVLRRGSSGTQLLVVGCKADLPWRVTGLYTAAQVMVRDLRAPVMEASVLNQRRVEAVFARLLDMLTGRNTDGYDTDGQWGLPMYSSDPSPFHKQSQSGSGGGGGQVTLTDLASNRNKTQSQRVASLVDEASTRRHLSTPVATQMPLVLRTLQDATSEAAAVAPETNRADSPPMLRNAAVPVNVNSYVVSTTPTAASAAGTDTASAAIVATRRLEVVVVSNSPSSTTAAQSVASAETASTASELSSSDVIYVVQRVQSLPFDTEVALHLVPMSGWLLKEGGVFFKSYQMRWFEVLANSNRVAYYEEPPKKQTDAPSGYMTLLPEAEINCIDCRELVFQVPSTERVFKLKAEREDEMDRWIARLRAAATRSTNT